MTTAEECTHLMVIDSVGAPEAGIPPARREVYMHCLMCGAQVTKLTKQTDEELAAEIEASKAIEEAYES